MTTHSGRIHRGLPLFRELFAIHQIEGCPDGKWNFEGQDTQYSTHGLHTYVAAMIPQLASRLIESYVPKKGIILDPFCGGGSVIVESIRANREAVGCDVNDLAVLVSKAKSRWIASDRIREAASRVIQIAKDYNGEPKDFNKADFVTFWFKPYMMLPLTALKFAIESLDEGDLKVLFQVLFSATVRSVSLTYRNEVRLRRMNLSEIERFNPDVFSVFEDKVNLAVERVPQLPAKAFAQVYKANARQLPFSKNEFTTVICSPPYGDERNGVNYTQFAKNMLYWLGYTRQDLFNSKKLTLGWGKGERSAPPSLTLLNTLEKIQENPIACREAIAFYADYFEALHQLARVTRERIIIVIGNRVLHKTIVPNAQITAELMSHIGVPLEAVHFRKLPTKRLPRMREFGAAIDQETILVFRK